LITQILKTHTKLQAIYWILNGTPVSQLIDNLAIPEIIEFQKYVWDLTVEFGIKVKGKKFTRKEITRHIPPTAEFQKRMGCPEKVYYCKGTHCIMLNPDCATKKIKEHVDIMAEVIRGFIQSAKQHELVENSI
jgi:hypothetical protein